MGEKAKQEPPERPLVSEPNVVHVYPLFGPGHFVEGGMKCWCEPKVEHVSGGMVIVHRVWN